MDRLADLVNCIQAGDGEPHVRCNHGGNFLDRYDWGYACGNCGASFVFKDQIADSGGNGNG